MCSTDSKPFAHGQREVLGGDVVLEVDERTRRLQVVGLRQHARQAVHAELAGLHAVFRRRDRMPCRQRRLRAHARAVVQDLGVAIDAAARTGRRLRLRRDGRQEGLACCVELELAARLREQVHAGRITARDQQGVALDAAGVVDRAAREHADRHFAHTEPATRAEHGRARDHVDARLAGNVERRARRIRSHVGDQGHAHAGHAQVERGCVGRIAAGDQHDVLPHRHAVTVQVGASRRGQHDARTIVARKHQRPFDGAGGQHHACRTHLPQPLAWHVGSRRRQVLRDPLVQADQVVREIRRMPWSCSAA